MVHVDVGLSAGLDVCAAHRTAAIALRAATRASGEKRAVGSFTLSCLTSVLFQRDAELSSLGLSHDHHWKILDKYIYVCFMNFNIFSSGSLI
jgi:hypothetical protein